MFKKLLRRVAEAFMGIRDGIALERQEGHFAIVAFRGKEDRPFPALAAKDEILSGLQKKLPARGDALLVPAERLQEVKRFLEKLPEDLWFGVEIAPEVENLRLSSAPEGFSVQYVWSKERGLIRHRLPAGVEYFGSGWFVSADVYWQVQGTTRNDDLWLQKATVEGQDIVGFASGKVPEWRTRGMPFVSALRYHPRPALGIEVKEVDDERLVLGVEWHITPETAQAIPSLPGYVAVDGTIMPGVSPGDLGAEFPVRNGAYAITGRSIPVFLQRFWPRVKRFTQGQTGELARRHTILDDKCELILTIRREVFGGIGKVVAVPALACGKYRFSARKLSQKVEAAKEYIRLSRGWLPIAAVRQAGIGPHGRTDGGVLLDPITLTPAEVLQRGSERLEGPWTGIEFPQLALPEGASPEETAQRHLTFLLEWGIPGGLVGHYPQALREVLSAFAIRSPDAKVLVVGPKSALDEFGDGRGASVAARFDGSKKDSEFDPALAGIILATRKGLETASRLIGVQWSVLCLLAADELIKSQSSKLFADLVDCYKSVTIGLFASKPSLGRNARREALSRVFGVASSADADLIWQCGLRDPRSTAPRLPDAYRLRPKPRPREEPRAAEVAVGGRPDSRGMPIPPPLPPAEQPVRAHEADITSRALEGLGFHIEVSYHTGADGFVRKARKLAWHTERAAHHVPFMCYWPTYDSMSREQLKWYFFWRGQVRGGAYPDTDLSYIFVHVYELLNGVGVRSAADGYEQLHKLWLAYRERQPKLDNYLPDWLADHAIVNKLPVDPLQMHKDALAQGTFSGDPDLLLGEYVNGSLENLPLVLLDLLTDYRIRKSKFYSSGYDGIVEEYMPRALARVDEHMARAHGAGVFETFRPSNSMRLRRYPFQSAVYAGPPREITIATVVPYAKHVPLRAFLNPVVKHTENKLRELTGYRGRLRGYALEAAVQSVIDRFVGESSRAIVPPPPPPTVVIDVERLRQLARESEQVRVMLGATGAELPAPPTGPARPTTQEVPSVGRPPCVPDHLLTDLDPVNRILASLTADEIRLMNVLRTSSWELQDSALCGAMPGVFVEPMVDRINNLSLEELGDMLIASEGETKVVAEDFRDELEYLLEQREVAARASPTVTGAADLPQEWGELLVALVEHQLEALRAIIELEDPTGELARIAAENATMPELLIDSINEAAMDTIGDVIVEPGSAPPVVEEEDLEMVERMVQLTS